MIYSTLPKINEGVTNNCIPWHLSYVDLIQYIPRKEISLTLALIFTRMFWLDFRPTRYIRFSVFTRMPWLCFPPTPNPLYKMLCFHQDVLTWFPPNPNPQPPTHCIRCSVFTRMFWLGFPPTPNPQPPTHCIRCFDIHQDVLTWFSPNPQPPTPNPLYKMLWYSPGCSDLVFPQPPTRYIRCSDFTRMFWLGFPPTPNPVYKRCSVCHQDVLTLSPQTPNPLYKMLGPRRPWAMGLTMFAGSGVSGGEFTVPCHALPGSHHAPTPHQPPWPPDVLSSCSLGLTLETPTFLPIYNAFS